MIRIVILAAVCVIPSLVRAQFIPPEKRAHDLIRDYYHQQRLKRAMIENYSRPLMFEQLNVSLKFKQPKILIRSRDLDFTFDSNKLGYGRSFKLFHLAPNRYQYMNDLRDRERN